MSRESILDELATMVVLSDICPRSHCGQVMTRTVQEHVLIRSCRCGYECKEIDGLTKLAYHQALHSDLK